MAQNVDPLAEIRGIKPKKLLADEDEVVVKSKARCVFQQLCEDRIADENVVAASPCTKSNER